MLLEHDTDRCSARHGYDCDDRSDAYDCDGCEANVSDTQQNDALPTIETELDAKSVKDRLQELSKRGKLPGFEPSEPGGLCSVAAHGTPFDSKLIVHHEPGQVRFECEMLPLMPRVFALLLIITIWPGLPLTEGFLVSFDWYNNLMSSIGIETWVWYLPLTILPAPFAYRGAIKKSRVSAHQSALETVEKLRSVLS